MRDKNGECAVTALVIKGFDAITNRDVTNVRIPERSYGSTSLLSNMYEVRLGLWCSCVRSAAKIWPVRDRFVDVTFDTTTARSTANASWYVMFFRNSFQRNQSTRVTRNTSVLYNTIILFCNNRFTTARAEKEIRKPFLRSTWDARTSDLKINSML